MTYRTDVDVRTQIGESRRSRWKVSLALGFAALISILALILQGPHLGA
jgi:hypothetical protein